MANLDRVENFLWKCGNASYQHFSHYLPLDGMVNKAIYLVWASCVRNGATFPSDNRYFDIQI